MYAAKYNKTDILKLLINQGANLKLKTNKGMTAMKYAKLHGATEAYDIIKTVLNKKKKRK